jgi:hypothetical protein
MYNGAGVQGTDAVLELAGNQGCRQPPQGSPPALASEEERTRSDVDPRRRFLLALQIPLLWRLRRSCQPRACKNLPAG